MLYQKSFKWNPLLALCFLSRNLMSRLPSTQRLLRSSLSKSFLKSKMSRVLESSKTTRSSILMLKHSTFSWTSRCRLTRCWTLKRYVLANLRSLIFSLKTRANTPSSTTLLFARRHKKFLRLTRWLAVFKKMKRSILSWSSWPWRRLRWRQINLTLRFSLTFLKAIKMKSTSQFPFWWM